MDALWGGFCLRSLYVILLKEWRAGTRKYWSSCIRNNEWNNTRYTHKSPHLSALLLVIIIFLGAGFAGAKSANVYTSNNAYEKAWEVVLRRIDWTGEYIAKDHYPYLADNDTGEWQVIEDPQWTGGFWVGMLWLAYKHTGHEKYLEWGRSWNDNILGHEDASNHDRGFVYYYSSVQGYRLTTEQRYRESAFQAASKLVGMQQPQSRAIPQNTKDAENIIIDTMMNLQLLWWAYDHATPEDPYKEQYYKVAVDQASLTLRDFIRPNGSTWQSVHYDTANGRLIKKHTHQGYDDSTCWSRGQSWGFYGFLKAFEATGKREYLDAAIKLAEYIRANLPEDNVPWYDYDDPGLHYRNKDTSAGAVATSAFLQLSTMVRDSDERERYRNIGLEMLDGLIYGYLTPFADPESPPGVLRHGCYRKPIDSTTIWGDYYLMEALAQILYSNNPE